MAQYLFASLTVFAFAFVITGPVSIYVFASVAQRPSTSDPSYALANCKINSSLAFISSLFSSPLTTDLQQILRIRLIYCLPVRLPVLSNHPPRRLGLERNASWCRRLEDQPPLPISIDHFCNFGITHVVEVLQHLLAHLQHLNYFRCWHRRTSVCDEYCVERKQVLELGRRAGGTIYHVDRPSTPCSGSHLSSR